MVDQVGLCRTLYQGTKGRLFGGHHTSFGQLGIIIILEVMLVLYKHVIQYQLNVLQRSVLHMLRALYGHITILMGLGKKPQMKLLLDV